MLNIIKMVCFEINKIEFYTVSNERNFFHQQSYNVILMKSKAKDRYQTNLNNL